MRRFFTGAFRIFLPRFIKFRTEKLFDIYSPPRPEAVGKNLSLSLDFSLFTLVAIMEPLDPIYRN